MGLFSTPGRSELKRAQKHARSNPSPLAYATLADKHMLTGDGEGALKAVQNGLSIFPGSDMLERVLGSVKRRLLQEDFHALHAKLAQEAAPEIMIKLARLYLETAEESKALETCARTIEKFPDCEDSYAIVADVRLRRFYDNHTVKDALIAVANLDRVISLNEQNYKAYQALAGFYLKVGMVAKALHCLKTMLVFTPDDEWTHKKMDEAIELPRRDDENLETVLLEYVAQHSLSAHAGRVAESASGEGGADAADMEPLPEHIIAKVDDISNTDGFRAATLLDTAAGVRYETSSPDSEPVQLAEAFSALVHTVQRHSTRMGIGRFRKGVVNGPFGQMIIQVSGDIICGVLMEKGARLDNLESEIESIAESALVARETPPSNQEDD